MRLEHPTLSGFLERHLSLENENAYTDKKKQQLLWVVGYQDEDPLRTTKPMNHNSCSTLDAAHVFTSPQNFPFPQEMLNPL